MNEPEKPETKFAPASLADVTLMQSLINRLLSGGNTFGEIGERVAAKITESVRISGTGKDLRRDAPDGWARPTPGGLTTQIGLPVRADHAQMLEQWKDSDANRFKRWVASPYQYGEVKARQLDRSLVDQGYAPEGLLLDTRGGGPNTPFFPMVDFYIFIVFGLQGEICKATYLTLEEVLEYAESNVGRGGAWNYKLAIGINALRGVGTDVTSEAQHLLETLPLSAESKLREG